VDLFSTVLLFAAAAQTVRTDQFPLRSGCDEKAPVVARLKAGDPVQIRFSLAGASEPCYVVSATVDGTTVQGNLPASALTGLDEFDKARRAAAPVDTPAAAAANRRMETPPPPKTTSPEIDRAIGLMERNQPEQALEILRKFIPLFPNNPELLTLAGTAAYKSDNLRLALDYWKQSLDLKPDPLVERSYQAVLRESQNDTSSEKKFGSRFLLRYDGAVADPETASMMLALLEQEFSRVSSQVGCRAEERIVTIVSSRESYLRSTGAPEWSGGGYDGKIHIPVLDKREAMNQARAVFAHEIVHACLANIGEWPSWFHEGLAQKLSGVTVPAEARQAIRALAKEGKLPKLAGLGQGWGAKSTGDAQLAYMTSLMAVELFYQHHSAVGIRNLMNNPGLLPRISEDLDRRLRE
jgi:hypothetical protein